MDLLRYMLPRTQSAPGKPASCLIGIDAYRLPYERDASGILHVKSISVIAVWDAELPQNSNDLSCAARKQYAIPASGNPAFVRDGGDATYMGLCVDAVLAPSPQPNDRLVWGVVEEARAPQQLPHGVPCWQLTQYLGAPSDGEKLAFVQCYLG
jgi:hypothetical protein